MGFMRGGFSGKGESLVLVLSWFWLVYSISVMVCCIFGLVMGAVLRGWFSLVFSSLVGSLSW